MRKEKLLLMSYTWVMMLCGGTVSGQQGVLLPQDQRQNTVRRLDTGDGKPRYIGGPANVGNVRFGAGESVTIENSGSSVAYPKILYPAGNGTAVPSVEISSSVSRNILMNNYNAAGRASGFLRITASNPVLHDPGSIDVDQNGFFDQTPGYPYQAPVNRPTGVQASLHNASTQQIVPYVVEFSHYHDSIYQLAGPMWAKVESTVLQASSYKDYISHLYLSNHMPRQLHHWGVLATEKDGKPYTTTAGLQQAPNDTIDNGTHLIQTVGDPGIRQDAVIGNALTPTHAYVRPTTVAVGNDDNLLHHIVFGDLEWYMKAHNLETFPANNNKWYTETVFSLQNELVGGCTHIGTLGLTLHQIGRWMIDTVVGTNKLDAAVQLLNDARVYVTDSIADQTGTPGPLYGTGAGSVTNAGAHNAGTDALLVFPDKERFTLRVQGDVSGINMKHWPGMGNAFFTENLSDPATDFPDPDVNIYMYPGVNHHDFNPSYTLPSVQAHGNFPINAPYAATASAIFGVKGDYHRVTNNAEIHTTAKGPVNAALVPGTDGMDNNPGVIEIGPDDAGVKDGYKHFHVYSGGMLKNFEYYDLHSDFGLSLTTDGNTPEFVIDGKQPLYIVNFGNNGSGDSQAAFIRFDGQASGGIRKVEDALRSGKNFDQGALHIQARGPVLFMDHFSPDITNRSNELRILSSQGAIRYLKNFDYTNTQDSNLFVIAQGNVPGSRSCYADTARAGAGDLAFDGAVRLTQAKKGITLLRSAYDDVFIRDNFTYSNTHGTENGEFILQAGQDIYGSNADGGKIISFEQKGEKALLIEAKQTIHIKQNLLFERTEATEGNIILKAGYASFGDSANIPLYSNGGTLWGAKGDPAVHDYNVRAACGGVSGGDIWLEGDATFHLPAPNTIHTVLRAKNAIYIDSTFAYLQKGSGAGGNTLLFAEQGNVEAIVNPEHSTVAFTVDGGNDTAELRIQAGNRVWEEGTIYVPTIENGARQSANAPGAEFNGNILLDKPLEINHSGLGRTLLSASRDIESQVHAPMWFVYKNKNLTDSVIVTAGRHIETHAKMRFDFTDAAENIGDPAYNGRVGEGAYQLLLQAGRSDASETGSDTLSKTREAGTLLTEADGAPKIVHGVNDFAQGGEGQGSILLFDSVEFHYEGKGAIILRALNGNIESDPYLHKRDNRTTNATPDGYDGAANLHNAPVIFNHKGSGVVRLEAIDIKLHDCLVYEGGAAAGSDNGRLSLFAFDSILTRNVSYRNPKDTGSLFITTAKIKRDLSGKPLSGLLYDASTGGPGIHQGHIVLGYGADHPAGNVNDRIVFDFAGNTHTTGANVYIRAGYEGFDDHPLTGKVNSAALFADRPDDAGKGYGGNITFDYIDAAMATGDHTAGGYMEISTPNGNIWGKDSLRFNAWNGDLLVDAGLGSLEDTLRAAQWSTFSASRQGNGHENILNTCVPFACSATGSEWRTGNIMMKGAALTYNNGTGHASFRTREGFIDTYDAFTASGMDGCLMKYAGTDNAVKARRNNWGNVSERDFLYMPAANSGSVFFGADNNIMLNYGNSNRTYPTYGNGGMGYPGLFDAAGVNTIADNPFYHTSYEGYVDNLYAATFNVNKDGFLFYRNPSYNPPRRYHRLYRGCMEADCSGLAGDCRTTSNGARDLVFDFRNSSAGGFAAVASNFIDLFTAFHYVGGRGTGLSELPGKGLLHGEAVAGYGLYIKSQFNGEGKNLPEKRRVTCENCGEAMSFPAGAETSRPIPEMTYIGFHDDARIHTNNQKSLLEAPVIEFFGHAEPDTETEKGNRTKITLRSDSLIFHDSVIFNGTGLELAPFTADGVQRANDMRYGVVNDRGLSLAFYRSYGQAVAMDDRRLPVLELGYQRCAEPGYTPNSAPNQRSIAGKEPTPRVGGDVIVAFKHGHAMPIFNTVVANHARISFLTERYDAGRGNYQDAFIRADLLRIRNKVAFFSDPLKPDERSGTFMMATTAQMDDEMAAPGMYTRHLHLEPESELSLTDESSLIVISTTVIGGYGHIHENVTVRANGIVAPGFASLMEGDCRTPYKQGKLTVHNLQMKSDAVLRVSLGNRNCRVVNGEYVDCLQTDTIAVRDSIFTDGKVPIVILPETERIEPGCYLFMTYGDSLGVSAEYVKNFVLTTARFGEYYLTLDYSTPGKVFLCVTSFPVISIQRFVDLPNVDGVTTDPAPGTHYVKGHDNFEFTASFDGAPLKVQATGFYSHRTMILDYTAQQLSDHTYRYTLYRVVEPWTISIGPDYAVANEFLHEAPRKRVWSYRNTLFIDANGDDVASICNVTGVIRSRIALVEGINKVSMESGLYIVTLKNGSAYKIIIR